MPQISAAKYTNTAKWKRQGGGVGWVSAKKMDLKTEKTINVGVLRCVYEE